MEQECTTHIPHLTILDSHLLLLHRKTWWGKISLLSGIHMQASSLTPQSNISFPTTFLVSVDLLYHVLTNILELVNQKPKTKLNTRLALKAPNLSQTESTTRLINVYRVQVISWKLLKTSYRPNGIQYVNRPVEESQEHCWGNFYKDMHRVNKEESG